MMMIGLICSPQQWRKAQFSQCDEILLGVSFSFSWRKNVGHHVSQAMALTDGDNETIQR